MYNIIIIVLLETLSAKMSDVLNSSENAIYRIGHYVGDDGTNFIAIYMKDGDSMSFIFNGSVPIDVQVYLFYTEDITHPQFAGDFSILRNLKIFAKIEKSPDSSDIIVSLIEKREIINIDKVERSSDITARDFTALITPENKMVSAIPV